MLAIAKEKIRRRGYMDTIELRQGEAEHIDLPDGSMDASIVAFGARNFEHLAQGLGEMRRVLRTGGRIVVLEFSRPARFPFKQIYFFYFRNVLPVVGRIVSKSKEAYTYLPDTVMRFPEGNDFCAILRDLGFRSVQQQRLTFGIATIYTGDK
jgi:demethylmenaquinone methyltransferase / 2-methoxy-6-polyprenyl-1,4-benzoquinol methylase